MSKLLSEVFKRCGGSPEAGIFNMLGHGLKKYLTKKTVTISPLHLAFFVEKVNPDLNPDLNPSLQ